VAECPIYQYEHPVGKVVLLEELRAVDLAFEEGVKVENGGTAVCSKNRLAGFAKGEEAHGGLHFRDLVRFLVCGDFLSGKDVISVITGSRLIKLLTITLSRFPASVDCLTLHVFRTEHYPIRGSLG